MVLQHSPSGLEARSVTDDLINKLTANLKPVAPRAMHQLLLRYATGGIAGGLAIMLGFLGARHDLLSVMTTAAYWMKFGYAALLLILLIPALFTLSRPVRAELHWRPLATLLACFASAALIQLMNAEPEQAEVLIWGQTALVCPWLIVLIALPTLTLLLVAMRRLAPANPALTGLAAGIVAGAVGVLIYSLHCPESGMPFIVIWYTLGVAITGFLGMIGGRVFLHW